MKDILGKFLTRKLFNHPLLVLGTTRSGTSALRSGLAVHPLVLPSRAYESDLIPRICGVADFNRVDSAYWGVRYIHRVPCGKDSVYEALRRLCFESALGAHYGLEHVLRTALRSLKHRDVSLLREKFWCAKPWFRTGGAGDEAPQTSKGVGGQVKGLLELYPEVKIIYIVRNGIDVVNSKTKFLPTSTRDFADHCRVWSESYQTHRCLSDVDNAIQVRQEEMVMDPESMFEKIFSFIGVEYHQPSVDWVKGNLRHPLDSPQMQNVDVRKILTEREPPYKSWSEDQRATFIRICVEPMEKLGYEIPFQISSPRPHGVVMQRDAEEP